MVARVGAKIVPMRLGNVEIRPVGGGTGCLVMLLVSVLGSILLTIILNVILR